MKGKPGVQRVEVPQNDWNQESEPLNVALVLATVLRNGREIVGKPN
jgi:hypothetical protein